MDSRDYEDILDECLRCLHAGVAIDDCIRPYPDHAGRLRAQLEAARALMGAPRPPAPDLHARTQGRERMLAAVAERRRIEPEREPTLGFVEPIRWLFSRVSLRPSLLSQAVPAALALLLLSGVAIGASAATGRGPVGNALPWNSSAGESEITGAVTFVDCAAGDVILGGGTEIALTAATELKGLTCEQIAVGDTLKVRASTVNGVLTAREVERAGPAQGDVACKPGDDTCVEPGDAGPAPTSTPDEVEDANDDNSGPDGGDDADDSSGPGGGDDTDDSSGPGGGEEADDSSGPGREDADDRPGRRNGHDDD